MSTIGFKLVSDKRELVELLHLKYDEVETLKVEHEKSLNNFAKKLNKISKKIEAQQVEIETLKGLLQRWHNNTFGERTPCTMAEYLQMLDQLEVDTTEALK